jgi:hypothetical protein
MSSNKRSSPDKDLDWKDTKLDELKLQDLHNLLKSRDMDVSGKKKEELIEILKEKGKVMIDDAENLTNVQLISELRLRGLNDEQAKKDVLIARYRGEDDQPPKKKQRVGKKKGKKPSCWVALYFPPAEKLENDKKDDNNNNNNDNESENEASVLGVFKNEENAYLNACDKILNDLQKKSDKDHKNLTKQLEKKDNVDNDSKTKYNTIQDKVTEVFGDGNDPYVTVTQHDIN